jgi:hypothetical protein
MGLLQQVDHKGFPIFAGDDVENLAVQHGKFIEEGRQQVPADTRVAGVPALHQRPEAEDGGVYRVEVLSIVR